MCRHFILLPIVVASNLTVTAQWELVQTTNAGVWALASNDTMVMAGALDGITASVDHGATWSTMDAPGFVRQIIERGTARFILVEGDGIHRSMDGGEWVFLSGLPTPEQAWSLTQNDTLLIAGSSGSFSGDVAGIHISADNGDTWTTVMELGTFDVFHSLSTAGNEVFAGSLPSGLHRSGDKGVTWQTMNEQIPAKFISMEEGHLLCGVSGTSGGVFLSTDQGIGWEEVLPVYYANCFARHNALRFTGTSNGFYYSPDNGYTWYPDNAGLPSQTEITSICVQEPWLFCGTSGGSIYRRSLTGLPVAVPVAAVPSALELVLDPSGRILTLRMPAPGAGHIVILNTSGQLIHGQAYSGQNITIRLPQLAAGMYVIRAMDQNGGHIRKFMIDHDQHVFPEATSPF